LKPCLAATLLGCSLVAACAAGQSSPPTPSTATPPDPARGIVVVTVPQSSEGAMALMHGTLDVGRCVFLRGNDGEARLLVFAMRPARWDAATSTLEAGSRRFARGAAVAATGAQNDYDALEGHWENAPAPSCRTPHVWVTFALE